MKNIVIFIIVFLCLKVSAQSINETVLYETPDSEINLYFVSQGFTKISMQHFDSFVNNYLTYMWSKAPYSSLQSRFRVIKVQYRESGQVENVPYSPFQFENVNNINAYICANNSDPSTGPSDQYLQAECYSDFYSRMDLLTPQLTGFNDKSYVLAVFNNNYYTGGGGKYASVTRYCDNPLMYKVLLHEFGHSFGLLADEYNTNYDNLTYDENCVVLTDPNTGEPIELGPGDFPLFEDRNVTDKDNLSEIPWNYLISANTPIPTCTTGTPCSSNAIGLFEGANYSNDGWYRSQRLCLMRQLGDNNFCQVCSDIITERVKEHLCNGVTTVSEDFVLRHQYLTHWRKSEDELTSTSDIGIDITVNFVSEESIVLEDGFNAKEGSEFKALIGSCNDIEIENPYRIGSYESNSSSKARKIKETEDKILISDKFIDLKLFPNPVKDKLNVSSNFKIINLEVFDATEKLLSSTLVNSNSAVVDFSRFGSGIYIVKVQSEHVLKVAKIIKQ